VGRAPSAEDAMIYWLLALGFAGSLLVANPSVEKVPLSKPIAYADPLTFDAMLPLPAVPHLQAIPWLATPPVPRPKVDLLLGPALELGGPFMLRQPQDHKTIAAAPESSQASVR
jgi:hypothetical protein